MEGNKKISEDHFILQSDIDKFFTCSNRNKMKFHPSKSKVLSITNQRNILHNLPLRGGGFSPDFCKNTILRYELAMMARTCTNNLRVVLSPYVQHCPCEASEQKMGPKNQYIKQGDRA